MEPTHFSPNQSSSFNAAKKQTKAQTSAHDSEVPSRNSMGSHVSEEVMFTPRSRRGQRQRRDRHFQNNSNDLSNVDEDMGDPLLLHYCDIKYSFFIICFFCFIIK